MPTTRDQIPDFPAFTHATYNGDSQRRGRPANAIYRITRINDRHHYERFKRQEPNCNINLDWTTFPVFLFGYPDGTWTHERCSSSWTDNCYTIVNNATPEERSMTNTIQARTWTYLSRGGDRGIREAVLKNLAFDGFFDPNHSEQDSRERLEAIFAVPSHTMLAGACQSGIDRFRSHVGLDNITRTFTINVTGPREQVNRLGGADFALPDDFTVEFV